MTYSSWTNASRGAGERPVVDDVLVVDEFVRGAGSSPFHAST
jgi:hypothetical protein